MKPTQTTTQPTTESNPVSDLEHTPANPPEAAKPLPDLNDELWTNAHLNRYFVCGTTTVWRIKKEPGFPAARQIGGLQRYVAHQVRAFATGNPTTPTTTTEGEKA